MTDPGTAPEQLLSRGKGYCSPKHYLLAAMFRKLGLDVVYVSFPFLWNDPDLQYPPLLRRLSAGMPVAYHLACRVRLGAHLVLVDATWDRSLAKAGFPMNKHWDGFADTKCAVKPIRSTVRSAYCHAATNEPSREGNPVNQAFLAGEDNHGNASDHAQYYHRNTRIRSSEEIGKIALFYSEFELWLESLRS